MIRFYKLITKDSKINAFGPYCFTDWLESEWHTIVLSHGSRFCLVRMVAKRVYEGDVVKNAILSFWRYCYALHRWSNDVGTMPYAGFIRSSMTVQGYVQEIVPHVLPNHKTLPNPLFQQDRTACIQSYFKLL